MLAVIPVPRSIPRLPPLAELGQFVLIVAVLIQSLELRTIIRVRRHVEIVLAVRDLIWQATNG